MTLTQNDFDIIMKRLDKFKEADEELERICEELGTKKPEMHCNGSAYLCEVIEEALNGEQ